MPYANYALQRFEAMRELHSTLIARRAKGETWLSDEIEELEHEMREYAGRAARLREDGADT